MTSATRSRAATLAGLLIGVLACEGEYRPYAPAQGAGASSSLAPETAQPALTPSPAGSPLELPGAEAQLTQPSRVGRHSRFSVANIRVWLRWVNRRSAPFMLAS